VSIIKRYLKDGTPRWHVRHRDPATGSHRSAVCSTHGEAKRLDAELQRQSGLGAFADSRPARQLVSDYLGEWFDRERHGWAASTQTQRADVLDKWIDPYIPATARLSDFAEKAVADWLGSILAAGAPATQARAALSILSSALGAAVRARLIPRNPCAGIPRPRVAVSRPRALTPIEVERLRAAMPSPRDALLVSVLFYAGLRVGEALALSWDSVRLDDGYLVVEQSFVKGTLKGTKTGLIRRVDLCASLRLDLEAAVPDPPPAPGAFVSPSRQGGGKPLDRHNWHAHVWKPAIERAGVVASPGDGRHTFASLHLNAGEPLIAVSNQLGHAMTRTTELYSHLMPRNLTGRVVPVDAAILAARAEVAGNDVRKVYALADYRRGEVGR
jgi:integrase